MPAALGESGLAMHARHISAYALHSGIEGRALRFLYDCTAGSLPPDHEWNETQAQS